MLALAGCDRLSSAVVRDAGVDSLASQWERVDAGLTNFNAVAGSAPDNVFIVGDQGTILHWNGTALVREESGTTANLRGVSVADVTLAFAVGEQGTVLRRQNEVWAPEPPLTTAVLNAVYAAPGSGYVLVAGEQGTILVLYLEPNQWGLLANSRNDNYYAVANTDSGPILVGSLGVVLQPDIANAYSKTLAGAVRYGSGAYVVGLDGAVFYWAAGKGARLDLVKGASGEDVALTPQKFLRAASVLGDTAWVVGHDGLVFTVTQSGATFTPVPTPDARWLTGVYAAAADDVWVVGRSGQILRGPPGVRGVLADGGVP